MDAGEDLGVPSFGRVEIDLSDPRRLGAISTTLRQLAAELDGISRSDPATAMMLAHRKIRAASKHLRGTHG